ncbi:MAG: hypothetical protein H0T73_21175 [Ardenticatenales bacterium]|nr:hypothetical protein [Ardenticatenales bacterium]
MAHELYHQMQWRAAGFREHGCSPSGWANALGTWYVAQGNAWLMEGTATWSEVLLYPTEALSQTTAPSPVPLYQARMRGYFADQATKESLFNFNNRYLSVPFFRFLQEQIATDTQPERIIRDIWQALGEQPVWLAPNEKSTEDAVTTVLAQQSNSPNAWEAVFTDFALTNYNRDYLHQNNNRIFDDPVPGLRVPIEPNLTLPIANSIPLTDTVIVPRRAALYHDILDGNLHVAGGTDATGATLSLDLVSDSNHPACVGCTLEVLKHGAPSTPPREVYTMTNSGVLSVTLAEHFSTPQDPVSLTLILANGTGTMLTGTYVLTATDNPPIAPPVLTAQAYYTATPKHIDLTWNAVREDGIRYRVYRSTDPAALTDTNPLLADYLLTTNDILTPTTSYEDTSAQVDTLYYYVVTAVDTGNNEGPVSGIASAQLETPPPIHFPGCFVGDNARTTHNRAQWELADNAEFTAEGLVIYYDGTSTPSPPIVAHLADEYEATLGDWLDGPGTYHDGGLARNFETKYRVVATGAGFNSLDIYGDHTFNSRGHWWYTGTYVVNGLKFVVHPYYRHSA